MNISIYTPSVNGLVMALLLQLLTQNVLKILWVVVYELDMKRHPSSDCNPSDKPILKFLA